MAKQGENRGCDTCVNTLEWYKAETHLSVPFFPRPSSLVPALFQLVSKAISSFVE